MVDTPTQYPSLKVLTNHCLKDEEFLLMLRKLIEPLYESCKKGNRSWERQKAYIGLQRQLPKLEGAIVEVFNRLTYRKR